MPAGRPKCWTNCATDSPHEYYVRRTFTPIHSRRRPTPMRVSQMAAPRANWSYLHHVDDAKHESGAAEVLDELRDGFTSRVLRPPNIHTYPLAQAADAYAGG